MFYPLVNFSDQKLYGVVTLCNFPPNNWEIKEASAKKIFLTYVYNGKWLHHYVDTIQHGEMRSFKYEEFSKILPNDAMGLLSLSIEDLPKESDVLPKLLQNKTYLPQWRATVGLSTDRTWSSYQGEIEPFHQKASLLSFSPFMQHGNGIKNYMILMNIEASPIIRSGELKVYAAHNKKQYFSQKVKTNHANLLALDESGLCEDDLALMLCPEMAGIPLYLSVNKDRSQMSLEHSHPPNCTVVLGERWKSQVALKKQWYQALNEVTV